MAAEPALDPQSLFRRLAGARGLILAVSGGPDSTALMVLLARWNPRPPAVVVCVDHGLRPEAQAEARLVARNAEKLGLPWRIVRPPEPYAGGNLQDWARRARYRCLGEAAREAGFDTLVTAHHRDDQAETFLLRLARGSGVYGLAGMAEEGTADGLRLARPLLAIPRAKLAEVAAASGLASVDDPSNGDRRYDRVRMRQLMPALAENGVTAQRLAETAGRLKRAGAALDHYASGLLTEQFRADPFGMVEGPAASLLAAPEEVGLRALAKLLQAVGGAEYTPSLDGVETLRSALLAASDAGRLTRTLHGAEISLEAGRLYARREWGRAGIAGAPVVAGRELVWDRRFRVSVPDLPGSLSVEPLGRSDRRFLSNAAHARTVRTLPGLFRGRELVAVPQGIAPADGPRPVSLVAECLVGGRLGGSAEHDASRA